MRPSPCPPCMFITAALAFLTSQSTASVFFAACERLTVRPGYSNCFHLFRSDLLTAQRDGISKIALFVAALPLREAYESPQVMCTPVGDNTKIPYA